MVDPNEAMAVGRLSRIPGHKRFAQLIEKRLGSNLEPHVQALAYHFARGKRREDPTHAVIFPRRAAQQCVAALSLNEAVRHLEHAIDLVERSAGEHSTLLREVAGDLTRLRERHSEIA